MQNAKSPAPASKTASRRTGQPLPTFLDHVHELRRRLFWVVGTVLVVSSVAYSFLDEIISALTLPLGNQQLFYLTPGGGLSFSFKLCAYVGVLVAVPLIMYHLYRFLEPLMGQWRRSAIFYVGLSSVLAAAGVAFAYFITLPAALRFLTGFNMDKIQAMLTADSYLSFVITYLLGAAILFQIPLLLLIINTMTPLKPSKLMKSQRFVIVGAFLLGAMVSPTPDIMNQTFLALPIIGMYQLGVIMVWIQNYARQRRRAIVQPAAGREPIPEDVLQDFQPAPLQAPVKNVAPPAAAPKVAVQPLARPQPKPIFMDIAPKPAQKRPQFTATHVPRPTRLQPVRPRTAMPLAVPARSVDGFVTYRQPITARGS